MKLDKQNIPLRSVTSPAIVIVPLFNHLAESPKIISLLYQLHVFNVLNLFIYLSVYLYCLNPVKRTFGQVRQEKRKNKSKIGKIKKLKVMLQKFWFANQAILYETQAHRLRIGTFRV